jgi:hypothetical protein
MYFQYSGIIDSSSASCSGVVHLCGAMAQRCLHIRDAHKDTGKDDASSHWNTEHIMHYFVSKYIVAYFPVKLWRIPMIANIFTCHTTEDLGTVKI